MVVPVVNYEPPSRLASTWRGSGGQLAFQPSGTHQGLNQLSRFAVPVERGLDPGVGIPSDVTLRRKLRREMPEHFEVSDCSRPTHAKTVTEIVDLRVLQGAPFHCCTSADGAIVDMD